jgi:hypothetical protein
MSARREARAKVPVLERPSSQGRVPAALSIGRCVEVWADPQADDPQASARRRFEMARARWAASVGADDQEILTLVPASAAWSLEYLTYRGQAERSERTVSEVVAERLGRAGCTLADLPWLVEEADELSAASLGGGSMTRGYKRSKAARR